MTDETTKDWALFGAARLQVPRRAQGLVAAGDVRDYLADARAAVEVQGMASLGIVALRETGLAPVLLVETNAAIQAWGGRVEAVDDAHSDRLLDARERDAWVEWRYEHRRVRVRLSSDGELRLETSVSLDDWEPPPPLTLGEIDVGSALERWSASPWLREQATAAARGTTLQRATVRTLIARYAMASMEELLAGVSPWDAALEEWRARPPAEREAVIELGTLEADALLHELDPLQASAAERRPEFPDLARAWLFTRDDLESLSLLAEKAGGEARARAGLLAALEVLDGAGRVSVDVFADANLDEPRLMELSWAQPEAWWGRP